MTAMARTMPTYRHLVVFISGALLLPNALMAPALDPALAFVVILGCVGSFAVIVRTTRTQTGSILARRIEPTTLALGVIAATSLCVLGGEGHFFFANYDWLTRDAVLADLVQHGF